MTANHTCALGIDTSCYVTSVAVTCGEQTVFNGRTPLTVKQGGLGLRQQEAVFAHIKNLPALVHEAFAFIEQQGLTVSAIGVSDKPRCVEGSYMPVFLAGVAQAEGISTALDVPLHRVSHQQGHLRAAEIGLQLPAEYIGVHLSGGTSEILKVSRDKYTVDIMGGSRDISAGMFIDRIGVLMGMPFPAGPELERCALRAKEVNKIKASVNDAWFYLSGAESECKRRLERGDNTDGICAAVLECVAASLQQALRHAKQQTGLDTVLIAGGVAANSIIKERLSDAHFAQPQYAGDNAVGVALLAGEA